MIFQGFLEYPEAAVELAEVDAMGAVGASDGAALVGDIRAEVLCGVLILAFDELGLVDLGEEEADDRVAIDALDKVAHDLA